MSESLDIYVTADLQQGWPSTPRADAVMHPAALSAVGPSFDHPQKYIEANSAMVTHMAESSLIGFTSPYVVSKMLVEHQKDYHRRRGLRAVVTRPFNHIGPGQGPRFLVPDLIQQLVHHDSARSMPVGNLGTSRDYLDVRDVARAYLTLATAPTHHHLVYNVCSGVSMMGTEILELICAAMSIPVPATHADPARYRPVDAQRITGSSERLREEFGWAPQYSAAQSIADAVAYVTGL